MPRRILRRTKWLIYTDGKSNLDACEIFLTQVTLRNFSTFACTPQPIISKLEHQMMYHHLVGCLPKSQRPLLKQHVHELMNASTVNHEFLLLLTRRHVVFMIILCKRLRILCFQKHFFCHSTPTN